MKIGLRSRAASGTTLVEVVIATAILGIMATGIIGSFTYGFFIMQLARENQRATQILVEKVETIRLYRWESVTNSGFIPPTFTDVYDPQAPSGGQGIVYQGRVTLEDAPFSTSYSADMRQLVVTLNWVNSQNMSRTRTFSTLIAKDGVQNYVY